MKIEEKRNQVKAEKNSKGSFKISYGGWTFGTINGGGPEYSFETMNGDIIIRKK